MKRLRIALIIAAALLGVGYGVFRYLNKSSYNPNPKYALDQPLDSLNGVIVYYNGMVGRTEGRNLGPDGYNIGMKHQCVEFVKRYYYQHLNHRMPDSYGNAKDFFNTQLPDSSYNAKRGLMQYTNGSRCRPQPGDLVIMDGHAANPYGHVAIIADTSTNSVTIIQQNPGPFANSRDTFQLTHTNGLWHIEHSRLLGWLRKDTVIATGVNTAPASH